VETDQLALRKWLNQPERRLFEAVVSALAKQHAVNGAMRSIHPSAGKQAAAVTDFQQSARYQCALEVVNELDVTPLFQNLKIQ
jgi:hypothetical protein